MKKETNTEKKEIYFNKFTKNLVLIIDGFFEDLENHIKQFISKEECDKSLTKLIEKIKEYKDQLDNIVISKSNNRLHYLSKLEDNDLLK